MLELWTLTGSLVVVTWLVGLRRCSGREGGEVTDLRKMLVFAGWDGGSRWTRAHSTDWGWGVGDVY